MIKTQIFLFYFLFLLISIFCACNGEGLSNQVTVNSQENENASISIDTSDSAQFNNETISQYPDYFYFVDTAFILNPFEFGEISSANILKTYPGATVESEFTANRYSPDMIDTILHINMDGSEFGFHRTSDKELFLGARIENNAVSLRNGIKIGMEKEEFISKFNFSDEHNRFPSVIQVGVLERTIYIEFEFNEVDILTGIHFVNYVD